MVSRITPEGSKLFEADILVNNPGSLTAEMTASATVQVGGETVYPYEAGKLAYYRTGDLNSTVDGTVISSSLVDYLQVSVGQVLVRIDGEDSENEIFTLQQSLDTARKELETAQKNLDNCSAVAPIDGMVIGLAIAPGDEIEANKTVVTIQDTSTILVNATVDERNISYIKTGMMVDLDQWGTSAVGTVETVSLSSTINNGVATYPITIAVDNPDGTVQVNSYINYSLVASQSDNCLVVPSVSGRWRWRTALRRPWSMWRRTVSRTTRSAVSSATRRSRRASGRYRWRSAFRTTTMSRSNPVWKRERRSLHRCSPRKHGVDVWQSS